MKAPLLLAKNQYLYWFDTSGLRRANVLAVYDAAVAASSLASQLLAPRDLWGEMLLGRFRWVFGLQMKGIYGDIRVKQRAFRLLLVLRHHSYCSC